MSVSLSICSSVILHLKYSIVERSFIYHVLYETIFNYLSLQLLCCIQNYRYVSVHYFNKDYHHN